MKRITKKQIAAIFQRYDIIYRNNCKFFKDGHITCTTFNGLDMMKELLGIGVHANCTMSEDGVFTISTDYQRVINHYDYMKSRQQKK